MSPRWLDVDTLPWEALNGVLVKVAPTPSGYPTPQAYAEELRALLAELAIEGAARPAPSAAAIEAAAKIRWERTESDSSPTRLWADAPAWIQKAFRKTAALELAAAYAMDFGATKEARPMSAEERLRAEGKDVGDPANYSVPHPDDEDGAP